MSVPVSRAHTRSTREYAHILTRAHVHPPPPTPPHTHRIPIDLLDRLMIISTTPYSGTCVSVCAYTCVSCVSCVSVGVVRCLCVYVCIHSSTTLAYSTDPNHTIQITTTRLCCGFKSDPNYRNAFVCLGLNSTQITAAPPSHLHLHLHLSQRVKRSVSLRFDARRRTWRWLLMPLNYSPGDNA